MFSRKRLEKYGNFQIYWRLFYCGRRNVQFYKKALRSLTVFMKTAQQLYSQTRYLVEIVYVYPKKQSHQGLQKIMPLWNGAILVREHVGFGGNFLVRHEK